MANVDRWLSPEGLMLIECWARDGLTLTQISQKMNISCKTLWEWRIFYPEIEDAINRSKEVVDYQVENALLKLALGGEKKTTKTIVGNPDSNGNRQVRVETTVENVLPNATAALAWLNNRKPKDWKRNRDLFEMANDDENSSVTINIVRASSEDKKITKTELEKKEKRQQSLKRRRERASEYEKAMSRIKKEKSGKGSKKDTDKRKSSKAKSANAELDENGWPVDWQDDEEW